MGVLTPDRHDAYIEALCRGRRDVSIEHARRVVHDLLLRYWQHLEHGHRPPRDLASFGLDDPRETGNGSPFGPTSEPPTSTNHAAADLAHLAPLDASFIVGRTYMRLLPKSFRSRHGVYFTPPAIARRLLRLVRSAGADIGQASVLDPACGGGAFLAPVVSAKLGLAADQPPDVVLANIARSVRGFEIDPFSAWMAQVFVDAVLAPLTRKLDVRPPMLVEVRDALDVEAQKTFDVVIGNPPYGRVTLIPETRALYRRGLHGHANLYGLFTDLALRLANPDGIVAFVTPTSFLAGSYFKNLRRLLAEEATPHRLEFVSDRQGVFDDVLQETLLATYRRAPAQGRPRAGLIHVQPDRGIRIEDVAPFDVPAEPTEPWLVPRHRDHAELVEACTRLPTRLRHLGYRVSTGPLVWNRHKDELRDGPGPDHYPLIWAESVTHEGAFAFKALRRNHRPFVAVDDRGRSWLLTNDPCVLVQRTTSKEQRRRLVVAELPREFLQEHGGAVVENHLNMVHAFEPPRVSARVVATLLRSRSVDALFRCMSGSVAVSAFELESLPLPDLHSLTTLEVALSSGADATQLEAMIEEAYLAGTPAPSRA